MNEVMLVATKAVRRLETENQLWQVMDTLRGSIDAIEYGTLYLAIPSEKRSMGCTPA